MTNADNADNPGDLIPDDQPRHLSARSLKTSRTSRLHTRLTGLYLTRNKTRCIQNTADTLLGLTAGRDRCCIHVGKGPAGSGLSIL